MGSEAAMNIDGTQGSYENFFKNVPVTSVVVPAKSTKHPETLILSHLDHLHMDRYVPLLLLYQLADNADATYKSFADRLKSSLAETLVSFYPLAGRVLKTADPDHPRQLLLNDRGVPFSEAVMDAEMGPFLELPNFKPTGYLSGWEPAGLDSFKQIQAYTDDSNPPVVVQVTRFNCGGVVLAMSWNHLLADMTGAVQFLTAWSEICRTGSTSIVPDHDRSVLSTHSDPSSTPQSNASSITPSAAAAAAAPPALSPEEAAKIKRVLEAKYELRSFRVRKETMDKVKLAAKQENPEVSSFDCLSAHIWRSLARAYAKLGVTDVTVFTTAVEGRSRMGVSPSYFGNVVTSASVMGVPAADILSKPLAYAAGLVRKAVKGITKETYWNIINQMDLRNPWKTSINRTDYQLGTVSWVRFGLNDIDFGAGRPVYVGVNMIPHCARNGQCIVLPSPLGEGNYTIMLSLGPHILQELWADPEFTSICS